MCKMNELYGGCNTSGNLSQGNRLPSGGFDPEPTEYDAGVLTTVKAVARSVVIG